MVDTVDIGDRLVGPGAPVLVIAEAGVNHDGDPAAALRLVDAAAAAGADAVKFQTFAAERLAADEAPTAPYQRAAGSGASQLELLRGLELSREDHVAIRDRCADLGLLFLSTPFDTQSADLLDELGVSAFKVASPDVTNPLLLEHVAGLGRPVLLSTGMATMEEVTSAVATLRRAGADRVVLLHCVSAYPARPEDANLRAMAAMQEAFGVPVGFSDHTPGTDVALAAAALGAAVLEKHLTLDRTRSGPDHAVSLEPEELRALVRGVRVVESALGDGHKRPVAAEEPVRTVARRSLAAARDLAADTVLTREMLTALRPATGIAPSRIDDVEGRTLCRPVRRGELLAFEDLV